jgi:hypothetical protein
MSFMLSGTNKSFMVSVVMHRAVMPNVVAPFLKADLQILVAAEYVKPFQNCKIHN